jgi:hypothetical protein
MDSMQFIESAEVVFVQKKLDLAPELLKSSRRVGSRLHSFQRSGSGYIKSFSGRMTGTGKQTLKKGVWDEQTKSSLDSGLPDTGNPGFCVRPDGNHRDSPRYGA